MKTFLSRSRRSRAAFTLIELLVVIAIIAILAAMLLPVLSEVKKHALKVQAQTEITQLVGAIQQYDSVYSRFPVSNAAQNLAVNGCFTYGGSVLANAGFTGSATNANSEVIGILMDLTNYPNGTQTINTNYQSNPQQTIFLSAKMSGYNPAVPQIQPPGGVDITGVYRDPWGNPYVISMDLDENNLCEDAFYKSGTVSAGGLNGLIFQSSDNNYAAKSSVMVWSAGPDGKASSSFSANQDVNKDNVISW